MGTKASLPSVGGVEGDPADEETSAPRIPRGGSDRV